MYLIKIAEETKSIVDDGEYINNNRQVVNLDPYLDVSIEGNKYYDPDAKVSPFIKYLQPKISVTSEKTLDAAIRLIDGGVKDVVALNFASAKRPGGGWLSGAVAQEEDLARCSALEYVLLSEPDFYKHYEKSLYSDAIILSPNIPFFRNSDYCLLDKPYTISILTCAAPNLRRFLSKEERTLVPQVLKSRIRKILNVMAENGYKDIILGAWGCGAFGNDPKLVAKEFKEALTLVPAFENVVFAIYDTRVNAPVLNAFMKEFE